MHRFLCCDVPSGEGQGEGRIARAIRSCSVCLLALLLALCAAGPARAQPTPETPGSAGGVAAVTAFTEAAARLDWATVGALLDPAVLARIDSVTRAFVVPDSSEGNMLSEWDDLRAAVPDSVRAVLDGRLEALADRLLADDDPAAVFARVLTPFNDDFRAGRLGQFDTFGADDAVFDGHAVTESDTLVRVTGRLSHPGDPEPSGRFDTTARWTGRRWAVVLGRWGDAAGPVVAEVRELVGNWEVWLTYRLQAEVLVDIDPDTIR